ncbi:MAG: S1 RNA-binding domain-containing protein [Anaerolineales bacterium]|nr:S1 RNA-binding domain-containing protein [Anaerolineales bacterium]
MAESEDFRALLESSEATPRPLRGDVLSGRVVALDTQGMIVDLGLKRDGVVPRAELDKLREEGVQFEVDQEVPVVVIEPEDKDGNLRVSVNQGRQQKDWLTAERLMASGEMWEGAVSGYNRGGLIVQFGDVQAFVPVSHITDLPRGVPENERQSRLAQLVNRKMGFKVIEVDRQRRRLVLSQRNAQKEYREKQKTRLLADLAEGQVRSGVVTGLRDFGAFVDLGGADGLIHISELSWRRVKHPSEVLAVGQEVEVEVLKVDRESKRIGLSLKRRQPDPWQRVAERFQPGQVVEGTLTRLAPFGAFVDLGEGVEGLLPTNQIANQSGIVEGAAVRVRILNVEPDRQRIGLALQGVLSAAASDEEAASPVPPPADDQAEAEYADGSADESAPEGED